MNAGSWAKRPVTVVRRRATTGQSVFIRCQVELDFITEGRACGPQRSSVARACGHSGGTCKTPARWGQRAYRTAEIARIPVGRVPPRGVREGFCKSLSVLRDSRQDFFRSNASKLLAVQRPDGFPNLLIRSATSSLIRKMSRAFGASSTARRT